MTPSTKSDINDDRIGKRLPADPEYAVISAFLSTIDQSSIGDVEDTVKRTDQKTVLAQHSSDERELYLGDENLICRNELIKRSRLNRFALDDNSPWHSCNWEPTVSNLSLQHEHTIASSTEATTANTQSVRYGTNSLYKNGTYEADPITKEEFAFTMDQGSLLISPHSENGSKGSFCPISRHTKLTELEQYVRELERDNLHLKQSLLVGKDTNQVMKTLHTKDKVVHILKERISIVENMVHQLNQLNLELQNVDRIWHSNCHIGIGVREWNTIGHNELMELWNFIRSIFVTLSIDVIELRPHVSDGEMILTKWRVQGEIAAANQLNSTHVSAKYAAALKTALLAIKSSDLTFTVTTFIIFDQYKIAQQYHCWDQVSVFKRLFGGQMPSAIFNILTVA